MRPEIDEKWIAYFRAHGFPATRGVAAGMEGAVYSLVEEELVAKVWRSRSEADLQLLKAFYDRLSASSSSILTPEIREISVIAGSLVSIERFLPGSPLQTYLSDDASHADKEAIAAVASVLEFLRSITPQAELGQLSVLDERISPWQVARKWSEAVQTILSRRITRYGEQLREAIPDLNDVLRAVQAFLKTRDSQAMGLVHGDLCGVNIMVDDAKRPLAVFDFGFLSMIGDPAFDASVTSAIFNMYGPSARAIDDEVTEAFERTLSYPHAVLMAYRAVYSLLTSNAYSADGSDGHFRWCISMLRREDVRLSLGL